MGDGSNAGVADRLLAVHGRDRSRLLDILWELQRRHGHLPEPELAAVAEGMGTTIGDVRQTASFYHLFRQRPAGRHVLYLADTVLARMHGYADVVAALEQETGAPLGGVDPTGTFGLFSTPCIGLSDQEPAMLLDDVVFTRLTPAGWPRSSAGSAPADACARSPTPTAYPPTGASTSTHSSRPTSAPTARCSSGRGPTWPRSSPRRSRPAGDAARRVSLSGLRGRGGAGFDTGLKWRLTPPRQPRPATSSATPTRASPAPSRIGCCSPGSPNWSSRAWC